MGRLDPLTSPCAVKNSTPVRTVTTIMACCCENLCDTMTRPDALPVSQFTNPSSKKSILKRKTDQMVRPSSSCLPSPSRGYLPIVPSVFRSLSPSSLSLTSGIGNGFRSWITVLAVMTSFGLTSVGSHGFKAYDTGWEVNATKGKVLIPLHFVFVLLLFSMRLNNRPLYLPHHYYRPLCHHPHLSRHRHCDY